jgi:hypothetical protein
MDGNGSMIFRRSLGAIFVLLSLALAGSAPGQNQDPIQALKDTLNPYKPPINNLNSACLELPGLPAMPLAGQSL